MQYWWWFRIGKDMNTSIFKLFVSAFLVKFIYLQLHIYKLNTK